MAAAVSTQALAENGGQDVIGATVPGRERQWPHASGAHRAPGRRGSADQHLVGKGNGAGPTTARASPGAAAAGCDVAPPRTDEGVTVVNRTGSDRSRRFRCPRPALLGYILTGNAKNGCTTSFETTEPGVLAVGDVRSGSTKPTLGRRPGQCRTPSASPIAPRACMFSGPGRLDYWNPPSDAGTCDREQC
jgi:hypothetical protein